MENRVKPIRLAKDILRAIFSKEKLPTDPLESDQERGGLWAALRWFLRPDSLPQDPSIAETRRGVLSWILKPEHLPQDPIPKETHKGFWTRVVEKEPLPLDPEDSPRS